MIHHMKYSLAALLIFLTLAGGVAVAALPTIIEEKDILPYLEKVIAWHRQAASLEVSPELPRELILKSTLQQHMTKTLNDGFAFAQTLASVMPAAAKPADTDDKAENVSRESGIHRAIVGAKQQIEQLQANLAHAKTRASRDRITGEMKLAQEHLSLLKAIAETIGAPAEEDDSLSHKIDQLADTVPEIDSEQPKAAAPDTAAAQTSGSSSASGILGLSTKIYGFVQAKSAVKSLLGDTKSLYDENRERSLIIRDALKDILQQGNTLGDKPSGKKQQSAPQPTYDDLLSDMKKLSKVAVALSQMNTSLTVCIRDLSSWVSLVSHHIRELLQDLFLRLIFMTLAIMTAIGLSILARKITRRYVLDGRRKDQLRSVRKAVLFVIIGLILFLGIFTDLNSLATVAGLLTAAIAFAMKDMILSVIAYFQFFSRSDIRAGDHVTVSGVTGKITQIGLLRFHVMELEKSDIGYQPTGRTVSFANTVLFQPTPFFRQPPGTNFVWREIDVTLSPAIDHEAAYKKLCDVVQQAYAKHREVIQRHEAALQKITHLKTDFSVPHTYLKITATGAVFIVRYAVERGQEHSLHQLMTAELLAAIRKDTSLKVLNVS